MRGSSIQGLTRCLSLARTGDEEALGRLFQQYRSYLELLARVQVGRRLQVRSDESDIVQETFLRASRGFSHFRGTSERELLAWLRQILSTTLAGALRKHCATQRRDPHLERNLAEVLEQSSAALDGALLSTRSTPSQQADRREQAVIVANALAALPEPYREVLVLRHIEGLSFPDVAERMDRSPDAVRSLWVRALTCLRSTMGDSP
jgi:RNA polymerase sigma-70 factor, ECF subfamily